MTRETKVGLLIGMGVILLIGIIVSDTLTSATGQDAADLRDFADQSQGSIFRPASSDAFAIRGEGGSGAHRQQRRDPIPTPDDVERMRRGTANEYHEADDRQPAPQGQRRLPTALSVDGRNGHSTAGSHERHHARTPEVEQVPTLALSHEWMLDTPRQTAAPEQAMPADDRQQPAEPAPPRAETTSTRARTTGGSESRTGSEIIHYVQRGETLYDIADKYYGSGEYWRSLAEFNRDNVGSDGRVAESARLVIPNRSGLALLNGDFEPAGSERVVRIDGSTPSADRSQARTIEVASGDTLSGLASQHLGSSTRWRDLLEANADQLSSETDLKAGMTLTLPGDRGGASPSRATTANPPAGERRESPSAGREYTVRSGDTLTRIAQRTLNDGERWRDVYEANRDQLASPDSLKVGQTLRIP